MIQTSFFGSKAPKGHKVCIAKWHRGWNGSRAGLFAPSNPKAPDWAAAYRRDLESRFPDADSLSSYLRAVERETPDPILCCFEAEPEECHRRVLAGYIKEVLGIDVPEWQSREQGQGNLL